MKVRISLIAAVIMLAALSVFTAFAQEVPVSHTDEQAQLEKAQALFAERSQHLFAVESAAPAVELIVSGGTRLASDATFVKSGETVRLTCRKNGATCIVASWTPGAGLQLLAEDLMGFLDLSPTQPTSIAAFTVFPNGQTGAATMLLQTATKDGTISVCDGAIVARVGTAIQLYATHNLAGDASWVLPNGSMPRSQVGFPLNTTVFLEGLRAYVALGSEGAEGQPTRQAACAAIVLGVAPLRVVPLRQSRQ